METELEPARGETLADEHAGISDRGATSGLRRFWNCHGLAAVLCAMTIVLAIGGPLFGRGVLLGADILKTSEPWSGTTPSDFVYRHGPVNDTIDFYAPERELMRDAIIHDHRIPLWNVYPNGGTPLGSVPNDGLLAPLEWPMLLLGISFGAAWSALLRLVLAAFATAALCRRLAMSRFASNCAAIIYCSSGFIIKWNGWPQSDIAALIPVLFLVADIAAEKRRLRDVALLGVVTAAILLEGYPPLLVVTVYALIPFLAVRVWQRMPAADATRTRVREWLRAAVPVAGGMVFGACLSAFQLLPFAFRLRELNLDYRTSAPHSSIAGAALFSMVFPWAIGSPAHPSNAASAPGFVGNWAYVGAAAMVFAVYGLVRGVSSRVSRAIQLWCAITALVIAVPLFAGLYGKRVTIGSVAKTIVYLPPLLSQVPLERFVAVFLFLVTLLAAFGIDRALEGPRESMASRPRPSWRRPALVACAVAGVVYAVYQLDLSWRGEQHVFDVTHQGTWIVEHSIVQLAIGAVTVGAIWMIRRRPGLPRRIAVIAIPVVLATEALLVTSVAYPRVPKRDYFPSNSTVDFLQKNLGHERFASADVMLFPSASSYYHLRAVNGHSFSPASWREVVAVTSPGVLSLPTLTVMGHTLTTATSPELDRLAAKYFVVGPDEVTPYGKVIAPPAAPGTRAVRAGKIATGSVGGGPLRAVSIRVVGSTKFNGTLVDIDATVRNASGKAVATGVRRLHDQQHTTTWYVPIAGELLAKDRAPWRVDLGVRSNGHDSLTMATTSATQLALGTIRPANDGLLLAHVDAGALIWRRLTALPRIRWASTTDEVHDTYKATIALALRKTDPNAVMLNTLSSPGSGKPGKVTVLQDASEHIRVRADAQGFGYVVVADSIQSGWTATVDGRRVPMRPADRGSVAIPVQRGTHIIDLKVAPKGWHLGIAISAVSALGALLAIAAVWILRRRRASVST